MEIVNYAILSAIGCVGSMMSTYVVLKLFAKRAVFDTFYELLDEIQTNQDAQKALYSVGALIGAGARSGFGIGKSGGKQGLTDLILRAGARYFGLDLDSGAQTENVNKVKTAW